MPELRKEVKTFRVDYNCDKSTCPGKMIPTGMVLDSYPPQYVHKCSVCDDLVHLGNSYPVIKYEVK